MKIVASEISNLYISVPVTSKEIEGKSIDIGKAVETVEKTGNGDGDGNGILRKHGYACLCLCVCARRLSRPGSGGVFFIEFSLLVR